MTGRATLRDEIELEIHERGPMRFDRFMQLALYAAGGYYETHPVGAGGDFITSPHVHPWFAYAVALAFGELHRLLGQPSPARIAEFGAGDGTLARQLLDILSAGGPLEYLAVEPGVGAREQIERAGIDVRASIDQVGPLERSFIVANELLDNLPFERIRRTDDRIVEIRVGLDDGGRLREVAVDRDAGAWTPSIEPGDAAERTVPTGAFAFVDALARRMRHSYALLIDYSSERGREVHGYRRHRIVQDILAHPGSVDVTAGVDFDLVEERARASGLTVLGRVSQRDAMLALGFDDWVRRDREAAGKSDDASRSRAWATRNRASLLVAPDGLGAHRWLLLATPDLPPPSWLADALGGHSSD